MIKNKNVKLIITIAIAVLIVGGIIYFIISGMNQEAKLKKELNSINELVNADDIDNKKIEQKLSKTVTRGKTAKVEKAIKQYLSDSFNNTIEISDVLNDSQIMTNLTVKNYQDDGPEFNKTIPYLQEKRTKLEELKSKYESFFTEEKAMSYIEDKNLDEHYKKLYEEQVMGDIENQSRDMVVEDSINDVITLLEKSENVLNFLKEHKDAWKIENEELIFNSDNLADQYNELIENL